MARDDVNDIISEMKRVGDELDTHQIEVTSIYIGGGTPTLLSKDSIQSLFVAIDDLFQKQENREITIECTPNTITDSKLDTLQTL